MDALSLSQNINHVHVALFMLCDYILLAIVVEMKRNRQIVNFGYEMSVRFKDSDSLPHIVEINHEDSAVVKDIKRLILQMTGFRDSERLHIVEVVKEMRKIKGKAAVKY